MSQVLTSVATGDKVQMTLMVGGRRSKRTVTVQPYHTSDPLAQPGHWYCVTHDAHFENQFQKDTHIHRGTHHLAWICLEHGIEQPQQTVPPLR